MDTILKRFETFHFFHSHTYGKIEVVNMVCFQLFRGCKHKNTRTLSDYLIYIWHSYKQVVHTSSSKFPFQNFFGYLPPSTLYVYMGNKDAQGNTLQMKHWRLKYWMIILGISICKNKRHWISHKKKYVALHDQHILKGHFRWEMEICNI